MSLARLFNLRPTGLILNDRDEAYFYNTANEIFGQMKAIFDTTPNYRNVLGIREFTPVTKENKKGLYNDPIWVLWITKNGTKRATEYQANTEPSHWFFGTEGQDANNDGKKDLGRLPVGVYKYSTIMESRKKLGMVFQLKQKQWIERDINHDGDFTEEDIKLIINQSAMNEGQTMHFHKGRATRTGSAGCQTFPPVAWANFVKDIEAGRKAGQMEFTYVLINK